jgi:7,8-dihydropterin-6-yl-methyl-4-(beta-D-ribofuranosyl)aminobenzene 5'-phosphate synthase
MKITTLTDNFVNKRGLLAEHGLSIYLEVDNKRVLFDTGQSSVFYKNAIELGVNISLVDYLVLSHGHYDHTGGVATFLENNNRAKIYAKREAFLPKYSGRRYIGTEPGLIIPPERLVFTDTIFKLSDRLFIVSGPIIPESYSNFDSQGFFTEEQGSTITDRFQDEQYLVYVGANGITIITGCSHLGIIEIVLQATKMFKMPVNTIIGGFHTSKMAKEGVDKIVEFLSKISPLKIGVCHCTGQDAYCRFKNELNCNVFYNYCGKIINL